MPPQDSGRSPWSPFPCCCSTLRPASTWLQAFCCWSLPAWAICAARGFSASDAAVSGLRRRGALRGVVVASVLALKARRRWTTDRAQAHRSAGDRSQDPAQTDADEDRDPSWRAAMTALAPFVLFIRPPEPLFGCAELVVGDAPALCRAARRSRPRGSSRCPALPGSAVTAGNGWRRCVTVRIHGCRRRCIRPEHCVAMSRLNRPSRGNRP